MTLEGFYSVLPEPPVQRRWMQPSVISSWALSGPVIRSKRTIQAGYHNLPLESDDSLVKKIGFNVSYFFWQWYDWTSSLIKRTFSSWVPWSNIPVLNLPDDAFRQSATFPLISIKLFSLVEAINDRFADSTSWMDSIRSPFWLMSKTTPIIFSIMVPPSSEPMHDTVLHIFTRGYSLSSILVLPSLSAYLLRSHHVCEGFKR